MVGNGPSFGGGLRITEGALLDDGMLDVVVIKPMSRGGLVRTYPSCSGAPTPLTRRTSATSPGGHGGLARDHGVRRRRGSATCR